MLSLRLLTLTLCALFLTACARSPVVQLYDGPAKSDSQVLTVKVPSEIEVFTINGKEVEGVNTFFASDFKELKLAPWPLRDPRLLQGVVAAGCRQP